MKEGSKEMKTLQPTALILGIAACASVALCMLTDWNDAMFLPLGLCLSAAANLLNALAVRLEQCEQ